MKQKLLLLLFLVNSFALFANPNHSSYRWRNDDGNEASATWKETLNVSTVPNALNVPIRLRIGVENTSGVDDNFEVNSLQYSKCGGAWVTITNSTTNDFYFINSSNIANNTPTTQQISTGTYLTGVFKSDGTNTNYYLPDQMKTEIEYCIARSTTYDQNSTYYFKILSVTGSYLIPPKLDPKCTGGLLPPTVTTPVVYNQFATASPLTATVGASGTGLAWYPTEICGIGTTTAPTPSTALLGSTSYWVATTDTNGCESSRTEIVVTVNAIPATHLNFDGVNDRVTIPVATLNNLPQGTISTWVKLNALTQQTICAKQHDGFNSYAVFTIGGNGASAGKVSYQSSNSSKIISNATLSTDQWYNLSVTFSSTESKLYIDGVLDNTVAGNFSLPNQTTVTATALGAWLGDGNGQYLNGNLDEFRVWNKVLTATDITNTMNCELQNAETGLVAYYKFNLGNGSVTNTGRINLLDSSGNFNHGTLTNFALTGVTSNWLAGSPIVRGNTCTSLTTLSNSSFEVANNIKMYPNPTNNFVMVEVSNLTNAKLQVVDITGKILMNQSLNASSNTINVQQLPSGIYFFKVVSNEGTSTNKIIKN